MSYKEVLSLFGWIVLVSAVLTAVIAPLAYLDNRRKDELAGQCRIDGGHMEGMGRGKYACLTDDGRIKWIRSI